MVKRHSLISRLTPFPLSPPSSSSSSSSSPFITPFPLPATSLALLPTNARGQRRINALSVRKEKNSVQALLHLKSQKGTKLGSGITLSQVSICKMEEVETELSADLFDQIDDLLDFPIEGIDGIVGGGMEFWRSTDDMFGSEHDHPGIELSIPPCDDMAELDWFSNFMEDSFSAGNDNGDSSPFHDSQFRSSSPISVLESISCSSKALPLSGDAALPSVPGRARSKRPRPPAFSPRTTATSSPLIISPTSSVNTNPSPFPPELESASESAPPKKMSKRKPVEGQPSVAARKCLHCGSQKTPQWRAGPLGPKTLCNACGVRYKSGRLFPEYRPAASPTFMASEHSNSHRKVMEIRMEKRTETEFVFQGSAVVGCW